MYKTWVLFISSVSVINKDIQYVWKAHQCFLLSRNCHSKWINAVIITMNNGKIWQYSSHLEWKISQVQLKCNYILRDWFNWSVFVHNAPSLLKYKPKYLFKHFKWNEIWSSSCQWKITVTVRSDVPFHFKAHRVHASVSSRRLICGEDNIRHPIATRFHRTGTSKCYNEIDLMLWFNWFIALCVQSSLHNSHPSQPPPQITWEAKETLLIHNQNR